MKAWGTLVLVAAVATGCTNAQQQKAVHSDAYVAVTVKAKLATVDVDSTTAVHVSASNGAVTLTGEARTPAERLAYVQAARSVDGVTSVTDRLSVNPRLQGLREQGADATLEARVTAAIAAQAGLNVFHISVTARNGVVTLSGTVPQASIARTVRDSASGVSGVRRLIDHITAHS